MRIITRQSVMFEDGNEKRFGQDHLFFAGIPSDVQFYPLKEFSNGLMVFIGDRHGVQGYHNKEFGIAGTYGNGAIYVPIAEIPEILDWCRQNLLFTAPDKEKEDTCQ